MSNDKNIQPANRTTLARRYLVGINTFTAWIEVNPQLQTLLQPYLSKKIRTFPPDVVMKIYEILGEPPE